MRLELKQHNRVAYERVMAAFERDRMTCVCHPTGTGKSYIVAAVTEHFEKVLILAPNNFVLRQQQSVMAWHKGAEYNNYQWLIYHVTDIKERYDLIVLDEFHRAGADVWGAAVELLIESQPQAKVLGTTATPIRYLNNERDMSTELFSGNVASNMTIAEAWNRSLLPQPRYVCGLFRWDKLMNDARDAINRSRKLSDEEKRQRIFRLNNKHMHWQMSYGMPAIIRRHLDKSARRVIVFCAHISDIEEMSEQVKGWFREAGFSLSGSYIIHNQQTDSEQKEQMTQFESNEGDGLRLMFSVNILNEGVHVPGVNAVLMLRTTSSRIIFMQQMGRCLTVANTTKPLVLDMVDNITTTTAIGDVLAEYDQLEIATAKMEGREPRPFEVIDYTLGIREVIEKLVPEAYTIEERIKILTTFINQHGRLPKQTEYYAYQHWKFLTKYAFDHPEVQAIVERFHRYKQTGKADAFREFYEKNQRYPQRINGGEERWLRMWWDSQCKRHPESQLVQEYTAKEMARREHELEEKKAQCIASLNEKIAQGMKGVTRAPEFQWLSNHYPQDTSLLAIREKYVKTIPERMSLDECLDAVEKLCEKNGYIISSADDEQLNNKWSHIKSRYPEHPRVKAIIAKYPVRNKEDIKSKSVAAEVINFWQMNGRTPVVSDGSIYNRWQGQMQRHRNHPSIQEAIAITGYGMHS